MKNLIIIPAYNESGSIEKTIADIKENAPGFDYVIINDARRIIHLKYARRIISVI